MFAISRLHNVFTIFKIQNCMKHIAYIIWHVKFVWQFLWFDYWLYYNYMQDVDAYYFSFLFFPMIYNSDLSNPKWMNLHFFTKFSRLFDSTRLNQWFIKYKFCQGNQVLHVGACMNIWLIRKRGLWKWWKWQGDRREESLNILKNFEIFRWYDSRYIKLAQNY